MILQFVPRTRRRSRLLRPLRTAFLTSLVWLAIGAGLAWYGRGVWK